MAFETGVIVKSVYLILDMQNDLIHPKGLSGETPLQKQVTKREIICKTAKAIDSARILVSSNKCSTARF